MCMHKNNATVMWQLGDVEESARRLAGDSGALNFSYSAFPQELPALEQNGNEVYISVQRTSSESLLRI